MEIPLKLILTACIVNFGLTSAKTYNQIGDKTSISNIQDGSKIQENFLSQLNSIAKHAPKKNKIFFKALKHEVSGKQQIFDAMKEELQISKNVNALKKRNFFEISRTNEQIVASKREANKQDPAANTAPAYENIFEAAESDDEEAVRYYIEEKGVLPNKTNNHEMTVAHIAARKGKLNIVKYMLEKDRSILNIYRGEEVFMLTIKYGNLDIVKYLVEELNLSIEKRFTNRFYGNTAIHFAAQYEEQEVLKYFLEERNGNVNVENDVMQTPLFEAVENRCHPMIKYLIEERGADVNKVDYMRETIMDKAIKKDDFVMLKYFIFERKMKVEVKWRNEQTHLAASFDGLSLMEFLVNELHTNVNAADPWGKTPLHKAAGDNNYAMCKYLLDHGANPNLRDVDGLAAVDETQYENITALLTGAMAPRNRRSVFEPIQLTRVQ